MNLIRSVSATHLALPFIIADLALLPMFHIGDLPWKPSLILIGVLAVAHFRKTGVSRLRPAIPVIALSLILATAVVIGAASYWIFQGLRPGGETVRTLLIIALVPLAFIVGIADRRKSHSYVGWVIVALVALNGLVFLAADQVEPLVRFYGLDEAYARHPQLYDPASIYARPAGIFLNANVSALMITILLTYVALGTRWRFLQINPFLIALFIGTALAGTVFLISRTQVVVATVVALTAVASATGRARVILAVSLVAIVAVGAGAYFAAPGAVRTVAGFDVVERLSRGVSKLFEPGVTEAEATEGDVFDNSLEAILERPFISLDEARRRISGPSWIWLTGTGPEESTGRPSTRYHNEWLTVFVISGVIGIATYAVLMMFFGSISLLLALPFLLPGLVNAFFFSPQMIVLVAILAGIVASRKLETRRTKMHGIDMALVAVDLGPTIDGSPVFRSQVLGTASALSSAGLRAGLIAGVKDAAEFENALSLSGVDFVEVQPVPQGWLPAMLLRSAWRLRRMNHRHSVRAVYARGTWGAIIAWMAFPYFGGPELIYDFRGDGVAEAKARGTTGVRLLGLRLITQLAIRTASAHATVSSHGADLLRRRYGVGAVEVIPSSAKLGRFVAAGGKRKEMRSRLGILENEVVLVYAGGLARYQMIPEMLSLWARLEGSGIRFLLLTSAKPGDNIVRTQVDRALPTGTISLTLGPEDVPAHLAAADIGFMLRQAEPLNAVASPVKLAEYLASGLAVVTSPGLGDASELVEREKLGIIVAHAPSPAEFDALQAFVNTYPGQREEHRRRSLAVARERYDWSAHADKWRRLVHGPGVRAGV